MAPAFVARNDDGAPSANAAPYSSVRTGMIMGFRFVTLKR